MVKPLFPLPTVGVEQIRQHYPFSGARDYLYASRLAGSRGTMTPMSADAWKAAHILIQQVISIIKNGALEGYGYSRFTTEYLDDLISNMGQSYVDDLLNRQGYETMTDPYSGKQLIFKDNHISKRCIVSDCIDTQLRSECFRRK